MKDNLHKLIKSLSSSEKRYFKIFAQRHAVKGENQYIRLFDFMVDQSKPSDIEVLNWVKKNGIKGQLAFHKHHLQGLLLRCLEFYHHELSGAMRIRSLLSQTELLFKRGLFNLAERRIRKAAKLAQECGHGLLQAEAILWQQKILRETTPDDFCIALDEVEVMKVQLHQDMAIERRLLDLCDHLAGIRKQAGVDGQAILDSVLETGIDTFRAKSLWFQCSGLLAQGQSDSTEVYYWLERRLELWCSHTQFINDDFQEFSKLCLEWEQSATKFQPWQQVLSDFEGFLPVQNLVSDQVQSLRWMLAEQYLKRVFSEGKEVEKMQWLQVNQDLFTNWEVVENHEPVIQFYYQAAILSLLMEEIEACRHWIGKLFEILQRDNKRSIQVIPRLIQMILAWESGQPEMIPDLKKNTIRYFNKYQLMLRFERLFLKNIFALAKSTEKRVQLSHYIQLTRILQGHLREEAPQDPGYRVLLAWASAKASKRKSLEVYQEM